MPLRLYNTFSKSEEYFEPKDPKKVTMYTCGPTVYGRPHIGNYSSFLMADLLRRWLEAGHDYKVQHAKNITDVGHLVADADTGEDKVEKEARKIAEEKRGVGAAVTHDDVLAVARMYEEQYLEDEKRLNMVEPEYRPHASEFVDSMKDMIDALLEKGFAYVNDDGIYFDVSQKTRVPYGTLSGNTLNKVQSGARVKIDESKKHPADFALWKFCVGQNANHVLRWSSPVNAKTKLEGFPGWHIECSAMSKKILGETIDLHTGGEDNIFPHHECEIAQSESVSGKVFVRMWLHRRRIDLKGEKMSKSLGNVLSVPHILERGYSALDIRYYLLAVHYRTNLKFSFDGLDAARKVRRKVVEWIAECEKREGSDVPNPKGTVDSKIKSELENFRNSMDADLNTPAALAAIFNTMNHCYAKWESKDPVFTEDVRLLKDFTNLIQKTFGCFEPEKLEIPKNVRALVEARKIARDKKDFSESDHLRDELKKLGYEVRDAGSEQVVRAL